MATRAVLFDLGNTLVHYYQRTQFPDILRECLRRATLEAQLKLSAEEYESLFANAMELNREWDLLNVRPLAGRMESLFPLCRGNAELLERTARAFMTPIFATARVDPAAYPCLDALRARGIKTASFPIPLGAVPPISGAPSLSATGSLGVSTQPFSVSMSAGASRIQLHSSAHLSCWASHPVKPSSSETIPAGMSRAPGARDCARF